MLPKNGFTLIELLVVVTVIVVLLAMLAPALDKAIDASERAVCATRLHQWGNGITQYWLNNKRKLMCSVRFGQTNQSPYPNAVWGTSVYKEGEFGIDMMKPYIQGVTVVGVDTNGNVPISKIGGVWYCPSTVLTPEKDAYNTIRPENTNPNDTFASTVNKANNANPNYTAAFYVPDYTFYGRVSLWAASVTHPQQLTDKYLEPGRILMSDTLYRWNSNGAWSYNHGPEGYSMFSPKLGAPNKTGVPAFSGVNQLFGDGGVSWKPRGLFDPEAMEAGSNEAPHTGGAADRNYY